MIILWKFLSLRSLAAIVVFFIFAFTSAQAQSYSPSVLPGRGLAEHTFLYCGEWDTRKPEAQSIFIVRDGKIA